MIRNKILTMKLLDIYLTCLREAAKTQNVDLMMNDDFFFEKVKAEGLASSSDEWFELGLATRQVCDYGPMATSNALDNFKNKK